jgi:hypothetical protein
MSNHDDEPATGITDEELPEDLQPTDDNPLAQPLEGGDAKSSEELDVMGGKSPEQTGPEAPEGSQEAEGAESGS